MKIACPQCQASYDLDETRIPAAGLTIKCPRCTTSFPVKRVAPEPEVVPLPAALEEPPPAPAFFPQSRAPVELSDDLELADWEQNSPAPAPSIESDVSAAAVFEIHPVVSEPTASLESEWEMPPMEVTEEPAVAPLELVPIAVLEEAAAPAPAPENLELLDFVDEPLTTAPPSLSFLVRRKNGKLFGPFEPPAILSMIQAGQLLGNEDVSVNAEQWEPLAEHALFAEAAQAADVARKEKEKPVVHVAPLVIRAPSPEEVAAEEKFFTKETVPRRSRTKRLIVVGATVVGVVALGVVVLMETSLGTHLMSRFRSHHAPAAVLLQVNKSLDEDTLRSYRKALELIAPALDTSPDDPDAQWLFCKTAFTLKRLYAVADGVERAVALAKNADDSSAQGGKMKAAWQFAGGDSAQARKLTDSLAPKFPNDVDLAALQAEVLLKASDLNNAAKAAERGLAQKEGSTAQLFALRAEIARVAKNVAAARTFAEKALVANPHHGRTLLLLAALELDAGNIAVASPYLDRLFGESRKELDGAEEARAHALKGRVLALTHNAVAAQKEFERALQLDPSSPRAHYLYGFFLLRRHDYVNATAQLAPIANEGALDYADAYVRALLGGGRYLDASKALEEAESRNPGAPPLTFLQGKLADSAGRNEEAAKLYQQAIDQKPDFAEARAALANFALTAGDLVKAKEQLDAALAKAPNDSAVQSVLGAFYLRSKDRAEQEKGKAAYELGLEKDPDDPDLHVGLGRALSQLGDQEGARKEMERAIALSVDDPRVLQDYGDVLRACGRLDEAAVVIRKALELDPKSDRARGLLGAVLCDKGDFAGALEQLGAAVNMNDRAPESWFYLGVAQAGKGDLAQAIESTKRALELKDDLPQGWLKLGLLHEKGNQLADAAVAYKKQIDHNDDADTEEHLGNVLFTQNAFEGAIAAFRNSYRLDQTRHRLLVRIGEAELAGGDPEKAIKTFSDALKHDPSLKQVHANLGRAYIALQRTQDGVAELERAREATPDNAQVLYELGFAYKDLGQKQKALQAFQAFVKTKAPGDDLKEAQDQILFLQQN